MPFSITPRCDQTRCPIVEQVRRRTCLTKIEEAKALLDAEGKLATAWTMSSTDMAGMVEEARDVLDIESEIVPAESARMRDRTAKNLSTLHTLLFRATTGRIGRRLVDNDMLLLSTNGRITGRTHTVPLLYLRNADDLVVIASWGGRDQHPEWYLNLLENPVAHAE